MGVESLSEGFSGLVLGIVGIGGDGVQVPTWGRRLAAQVMLEPK